MKGNFKLAIIFLLITALAIPVYASVSHMDVQPVPPQNIRSEIIQEPLFESSPIASAIPIDPEPLDPGCPTDDTYITTDTVLSGEYCEIADPNDNGVLIINADNIVLDCNGTTLDGIYNFGMGIVNQYKNNVTIKNCNITRYQWGIMLVELNKNDIINNNFTDNSVGVLIPFPSPISSHNTTIEKNIFTKNWWGIYMDSFSDNFIITNNGFCNNNLGHAITLVSGTISNSIYRNNFFNNGQTGQVEDLSEFNQWDNGLEGNYWSDYNGTDLNGDGIGDNPYIIDNDTQDNFPLMKPNLNAPVCEPLENDTEPEIIYSSLGTSYDIWGMQEDGSNKIQITSDNTLEAFPIWSPDNSKISFLSSKGGTHGLWIMNPNGTNQIQVTQNITGFYGDWSPDGNKLVFASKGNDDSRCSIIYGAITFDCEIYTINIDGNGLTRLTDNSFSDIDPRWSPNGNKIIFTSKKTGDFELWLIDSDGSNLRQLTSNMKDKGMPVWSLDGSKIVFVEEMDNETSGLYIMNADGTGKKLVKAFNISDSFPMYPSFSPDGQRITYSRYYSDGTSYIHVINIDGTGDVRLTDGPMDLFSDWKNGPIGNDTTPPLPPVLQKAVLTGPNYEDVDISWYASPDEGQSGGTVEYQLWRSTEFDGIYSYFAGMSATGASAYGMVINFEGDGNPNNYFYFIRAVDAANNTADSWYAGKFVKPLTAGEKFISIPLVQWDTSVEEVLKTLDFDKVRYYNASDLNDHWKTYMSFKTYKGDLRNIDHKIGFWVNVINDDNLTVAGLVPKYTEIPLYQGWNMVGYPSFINRTVSEALAGIPWLKVEAYDNNPPHYLKELSPSDIMSAGNGYWIEVSEDSLWNVTNNKTEGKKCKEIIQITNDSFDESSPDVYEGKIVYTNYTLNPLTGDIYMYDVKSSTTTRITHNTSVNDWGAEIYGDIIVWTHVSELSDADIYMYNISSGITTPIVTDPWIQFQPDIHKDIIVYTDFDSDLIMIYNLSSGLKSALPNSSYGRDPDIFGDKIVWDDYDDIYIYDLSTGQTNKIIDNPADQWDPKVYNNFVAFLDDRNRVPGEYGRDVYLYNMFTGEEIQIADGIDPPYVSVFPPYTLYTEDIFNGLLFWTNFSNIDNDSNIYMYKISENKNYPFAITPEYEYHPRIHGNEVVWTAGDIGNNIFYCELI